MSDTPRSTNELRGIDPKLIKAANDRRVLIAPANVEPAMPQTTMAEPKPSDGNSNIIHYIMEGAMCVPVVGNVLALKDVAYDSFELCKTDAQGKFSNLSNVWLWATLTIDGIGVIPAAGNASAPVRAIIRHGLWEFARGAGLALLIDKLLSVFHGNIEVFLLKLESWIEQLKGLLVTYTQKLGNSLADFIHSPYAWAEQMKLIEKNWTAWPSDNGKKLVFRGMENLLGCMDPKMRVGLEKGMRLYSRVAAQQIGAAILKVLPIVMAIGNAVRERRIHTQGVQKGAQIANGGKAAQAVKHQQGASECTRTKGNNSPVAPSYSAPCPVQHLAPKATTRNPIHLVMGDENLWQTDFVVPGIVDLEWTRFYRSSCDRLDDSELGARWSTPYHIRFELSENALYFIDEDNRMVPLAPLAVGETRFEPVEKLTLTRPSDNEIVCTTLDNQVQRFVAMAVRPAATPESTDTQIFRLVEQREQDGRTLQFAYAQGRLTQITDGAAMDVRLSYGEQGLVTQIDRHFPDSEHPPEVLARYTHDAHRDLITHTDPRERERSYRYEQHLLTFYSNRNGLGCHLEWQWPGQADGQPADAQHARCTRNWLDDGSEDTHFEYNRGLWYTKVTDAQNLITYYRYNEHNRLESRMHPYQPSLGSEHWRWDAQGNLIAHFDGEGRTTAMEYDAQGRLTKVTDPMSRTTAYEYDDQGRLTKTTDPVGRVEETRYDGQGRVVEEIDYAGRATKIAYDDLGQPIAVTDPADNTYQYTWNEQGQLTTATDCSGQVTQFVHDHRGQLIQQIDALGHRVQFQRDPMGLPEVIRYPDETREQFAYDGEGDLIRHTDAEGHETRYAYDGKGLPIERIDAAGFRLAYRYDSLRRLTALTNQNGEAWTFDFDGAGRVTREVGFDGRTRTYEYDEGGLLRTRREDDVTTHFKHDALGLLKQLRTERPAFEPVETNYAHDMLGRLTAVTNRTADVRLHYDNGDNLIAEEQTSRLPNREQHRAVYRHSYDILGNRLTTQLPNGQEVAWLRYGSGHVHAMALDGAKLFDFGRDALHREIARHTDTQSQTRQYDAMGRLTRQQRLQGKETVQQRLYHYTKASELGSIDDSLKGQTRYAYDPLGRLKRATSPLNDERFAFDPAGNLLDPEWLEQQARKDKADPKASRDSQPLNTRWDVTSDEVAFDYAHLPKVMGNLLQQYAGTHYQHDVRGNRIRETAPGGHTTEYTYDAEDRLIAAKRYRRAPAAGDNATPEMQAKYGYDGFGRRLYKLVKSAKRPAQLTVFTWDGDLLTSEETFEGEYSFLERWAYPEAPPLTREVPDERYSLPIAQRVHSIVTQPQQRTHWLYEPESFIPAAQQVETYQDTQRLRTGTDAASLTTAGATTSEPRQYLIHTDHLGTPQELTDSDGTLQWAGQYRAWGELQKATDGQNNAASIDMRLRFQGQYCDEETGLHYNRFRYYDPRVGRFTTQDPISLTGGINLYQYAPNPVGWVDPYGLQKQINCNTKEKCGHAPCPKDDHLYRGVSAKHPAIEDAKKGSVIPSTNVGGASVKEHNAGGHAGNSQYTSWSRDENIARWHANKDGPGGVLLSAPLGAPKPKDKWSWEFSDDIYHEQEVLLKGPRHNSGRHNP